MQKVSNAWTISGKKKQHTCIFFPKKQTWNCFIHSISSCMRKYSCDLHTPEKQICVNIYTMPFICPWFDLLLNDGCKQTEFEGYAKQDDVFINRKPLINLKTTCFRMNNIIALTVSHKLYSVLIYIL